MTEWYYQAMGSVVGPIAWDELREKADREEISEGTPVREGPDGPWRPASHVDGLIEEPVGKADLQALEAGDEAAAGADAEARTSAEGADAQSPVVRRSPLTLRPCADCGKMVSRQARTCPECGRSFRGLTFEVPYAGEHPVPVWVFFALLAAAFVLASPVLVHRLVLTVASTTPEAGEMAAQLAIVVAGCYVVSMLVCAAVGGAVGAPRMAYFTGLLLGLFFGPLGVFAAFAIDKRPRCPNCLARLNGLARECPACHSSLTWVLIRRWY